ncbi:hypothetical protein HYV43_05340 [Candidatus Micrarchaeota archaeon]|nr:hypothetical protein [Candidatus Micrarchaeota archaeon]
MIPFFNRLAELESTARIRYDQREVKVEHFTSGRVIVHVRAELPDGTNSEGAGAYWEQIKSELKPAGLTQLRIEPGTNPKEAHMTLTANIYAGHKNLEAARERIRQRLEIIGVLPRKVIWDKPEPRGLLEDARKNWQN